MLILRQIELHQTYTSSVTNTANKLYSIVPPAYGGLAYENSGTGSNNCDFVF